MRHLSYRGMARICLMKINFGPNPPVMIHVLCINPFIQNSWTSLNPVVFYTNQSFQLYALVNILNFDEISNTYYASTLMVLLQLFSLQFIFVDNLYTFNTPASYWSNENIHF
jgi:hypothetical protein